MRVPVALISLVMVVTMAVTSVSAQPAPASDMATELAVEYVVRDRIVISGNDAFTEENGVVSGTGRSDDPYIIEGWEIVFNNTGTCISVSETDRHFVVRDVHLVGAMTGVRLTTADHARITDSIIDGCAIGISASYSDVSSADHNTISNCSVGISLRYCDEFDVDGNTYLNNEEDFREIPLPWITTRQANLVFAVIAAGLGAFVILLVYMRMRSGKPPADEQ